MITNEVAGSEEAGPSTSGIRHRPKKPTSSGESIEATESEGKSARKSVTSGSDFERPRSVRPARKDSLKRICMHNTAEAAYRTGASVRQVALISSAALQHAGVKSSEDKSHVFDRSKVRTARDKLGDDIQAKRMNLS